MGANAVDRGGHLWTVPWAYNADHAIVADTATSVAHAPLEGYEIVDVSSPNDNHVKREAEVTVPCPSGKQVVGGGGNVIGEFQLNDAIALVDGRPAGVTQWYVGARTTVEKRRAVERDHPGLRLRDLREGGELSQHGAARRVVGAWRRVGLPWGWSPSSCPSRSSRLATSRRRSPSTSGAARSW
jgi:hypothetical protein